MITLGIDPSDTKHAWAVYDSDTQAVLAHGRDWLNDDWALPWDWKNCDMVAIEMVASYGMAAGASLFDTCVKIGQLVAFMHAWFRAEEVRLITRIEVKKQITGRTNAKDSNIRQALLDMWGGVQATKKGQPLHGIAGDTWAALAVAVAASRPSVEWYRTAAECRGKA